MNLKPLALMANACALVFMMLSTSVFAMLQRLSRISQPWNIVYTIPGLTGIQAAIAEGLGVTALAKSTVPPSLDIVRESERFPELGDISISLLRQADSTGEAIDVLAEYIKTSLA